MVPSEAPHLIIHVLRGQFPEVFRVSGPEMDACVWSNLPDEVLERVLARLPGGTMIRMSVVCKKWCSLFSSPQFRQLRDSVQPLAPAAPPPICVMEYHPGHLLPPDGHPLPSAFSYMQQARGLQLHRLTLSFLPGHFLLFSPWNFLSQEGLVCIFKSLAGSGSSTSAVWGLNICVANPLTKTWLELPPYGQEEVRMRRRDWRVEFEVEKTAAVAHFRVMLLIRRVVDGTHRMCVHTFSSKSSMWNLVFLEGGYHGKQMQQRWPLYGFSKTCLYSLSLEHGRQDLEAFVHEMDAGTIVHSGRLVEIDDPCRFIVGRDGVFCAGESVGLMVSQPSQPDNRIGLWQLNANTFLWDKVSDLPGQLERSLLNSPGVGQSLTKSMETFPDRRLALDSAIIVGDTVLFTLRVQNIVDFSLITLWSHLVAYHLKSGSWELVFHGLPSHNTGCGRYELCPDLCRDLGLGMRPEAFHNPYQVFVPCFNDVE